MNPKAIYNKIVKDTRAVSPVVASLILVVVAVVGAATIGVMMGVVGEDVGEQADAEQVGDASKAMIELASSGGGLNDLRFVMKDFKDENPGVGILKHEIESEQAYIAMSMGIADISVAGRTGRARIVGPILNNTDNAQFNASAIALGHTNFSTLLGNVTREGRGRIGTYRRDAGIDITTILNNDNHPQFQAAWDAHLTELGVQEVHTNVKNRRGEIREMFFITLGNPSPIEQSFIDYVRLKGFSA